MRPKNKMLKDPLITLFHNYHNAAIMLSHERDKRFPPGTKARSRIDPDMIVEVTSGSFYPDQVNTRFGHMSWQYLEVIP